MSQVQRHTIEQMVKLGFLDDTDLWTPFDDGAFADNKPAMLSRQIEQYTVYADGGTAWFYVNNNEPEQEMRWYRYPGSSSKQVEKWLAELTYDDLPHFRCRSEK